MTKHLAPLLTLSLLLVASPSHASFKPPESSKPSDKTAAKAAEKLEWLAFDAATAKAQSQNKHVIVDIYTTWCGWCKVMERDTYGDSEVAAYLRDNFVLAKVNGESSSKLHWQGRELTEHQFARAVGVTGYPATYFLKPNADLLGGVGGYIRSPDFMVYAHYVSTRWYEKGKIQAYVDSLRSAAQ
jgi:uncharacterized protein YyaL (SSP411 family)